MEVVQGDFQFIGSQPTETAYSSTAVYGKCQMTGCSELKDGKNVEGETVVKKRCVAEGRKWKQIKERRSYGMMQLIINASSKTCVACRKQQRSNIINTGAQPTKITSEAAREGGEIVTPWPEFIFLNPMWLAAQNEERPAYGINLLLPT